MWQEVHLVRTALTASACWVDGSYGSTAVPIQPKHESMDLTPGQWGSTQSTMIFSMSASVGGLPLFMMGSRAVLMHDSIEATLLLVSGVTDAHLADDLYLEYSRIINNNTFLTMGVSVSFPGKGIDDVVDGDAGPWTGGFINVVFNF